MARFYEIPSGPKAPTSKPTRWREAPSAPAVPTSPNRPASDVESIIAAIKVLRSSPGYLREEVVSPLLKKFLPSQIPSDAELRKRFADMSLCPRQIAYLAIAARDENERVAMRGTQSYAHQRSLEGNRYPRRSGSVKRDEQ